MLYEVITITSNDPDDSSLNLPVTGRGVFPPVITIAQDSFAVSINEGDSTSRILTIGNAGLGELRWKFGSADPGLAEAAPTSLALVPRTESEMADLTTLAASGTTASPGSIAVPETIGTNEGTPTISPYSTDQLMHLTGSKRILAWIGYTNRNPGGEYENTRITSYNVCYTKLLRTRRRGSRICRV